MCRNIKTLFNFNPPATEEELHEASLQFVRKISGFRTPSKVNQAIFNDAVDRITADTRVLIQSLTTQSAPRDRETEKRLAQARTAKRFG